jgi:SET domain-containing protein
MLYKDSSRNGIGVFADAHIRTGEAVIVFQGQQVHGKDLPEPYIEDKYVQIGPDLYIGPSGGLDDFVNHSCDPNCKLDCQTFELVAMRNIEAGEEITFDYCLTIKDDWRIECHCGLHDVEGL